MLYSVNLQKNGWKRTGTTSADVGAGDLIILVVDSSKFVRHSSIHTGRLASELSRGIE